MGAELWSDCPHNKTVCRQMLLCGRQIFKGVAGNSEALWHLEGPPSKCCGDSLTELLIMKFILLFDSDFLCYLHIYNKIPKGELHLQII